MANERYRVSIDGEWTLADLYRFPRTYLQLYSFFYVLRGEVPVDLERREQAFRAHPWRGGYSAVNFYNDLGYLVPPSDRPRIQSIRFESPGWIDLGLAVGVAITIGKLVSAFTNAGAQLNALYSDIYKGLHERKLMRIKAKREELQLHREQLQFLEESCQTLSRLMGLKNLEQLHALTPNPLATLKILLSVYRRVRTLAGYEDAGKAKFS